MQNAKKNDVIQINEKCGNNGWIGCLMIVDEVKSWGVQAYLHVPMQGDAYLRIKHGEYDVIRWAADAGFVKYIPLVFCKNYSPQVLKANMKIVGATEHALVLYRDRLPKFNNYGKMIFNWMPWERDGANIPKIHPTQKPVKLLKRLIDIFTDPGDVVIDPCAGSGSTLRAAAEMRRNAYGFEIDRNFYRAAKEQMLNSVHLDQVSLLDLQTAAQRQTHTQMRMEVK